MKQTAMAQVAFEYYAALGSGRSLSKLHRHLTANVPDGWDRVPSERTLKEWSRQHRWGETRDPFLKIHAPTRSSGRTLDWVPALARFARSAGMT